MNLGRSGTTRSKSRSPALASPSPYIQGSSPRTFLPPSHYAAAAGVPYTSVPVSSNGLPAPSDGYHAHTRSRSAKYAPPSPAPTLDDTYTYTSSRGGQSPVPVRDDKLKRRKSQVELLETNLLPSLRDTIGRMTQPTRPSPSLNTGEYMRYPSFESSTPSAFPPSSLSPMERHTPYTPQFSSPHQSSRSERMEYPTPTSSGTPQVVPPPILKSALRLPGHATPSRPADGVSSPVTQSLRRVKSFASSPKAPSQARPDNVAVPSIPSALKKKASQPALEQLQPSRPARARSVTNPDPQSTRQRARTDISQPLTPQLSQSRTPSALPRRIGNPTLLPRRSDDYDSESSTAEYERDLQRKNRRTLLVTNATIYPSSSESDGDAGSRTPLGMSKLPRMTDRTKSRPRDSPAIGLGLRWQTTDQASEAKSTPTRSRPRPDREDHGPSRHPHDSRDEDTYRQYNPRGDDGMQGSHLQDPFPQPIVDYEPSIQILSEDEQDARRRRRETLVNLVDTLQLNLPASNGRDEGYASETVSEAATGVGMAISGSSEVNATRPRMDEAHERSPPGSESDYSPGSDVADRFHEMASRATARTSRAFQDLRDSGDQDRGTSTRRSDEGNGISTRNTAGHQNAPVTTNAASYQRTLRDIVSKPQPPTNSRPAISPSVSRETEDGRGMLAQANSDLSSVYSEQSDSRWDDGQQGLSGGAEALFRRVRDQNPEIEDIPSGRPSQGRHTPDKPTRRVSFHERARSASRGRGQDLGTPTRYSALDRISTEIDDAIKTSHSMSTADSCASYSVGPSDDDEAVATPAAAPVALVDNPAPTWRGTLDARTFSRLEAAHGPQEMARQQVIWEIRAGVQAFVRRVRAVVRTFVQPLRHQDSRAWIQGVPAELRRLFDWLDDVLAAHAQLWGTLRELQGADAPVTQCFAEHVGDFVPRLEVYQPYMAKVDSAVEVVRELVKREESDFGAFVRMQEREGMRLEEELLHPVTVLKEYPRLFRRLWQATPRTHQEWLPSFSLLHSTEMVIHVMQEVKIREDEYDTVKDISARISGIPAAIRLASRERRLLMHGPARLTVKSASAGATSLTERHHYSTRMDPEPCDGVKGAMFVFTDLMLLALPHESRKGTSWTLLKTNGVSRVLTVEHVGDDIEVDILPISGDEVATGVIAVDAPIARASVRPNSSMASWGDALERAANHTVRSLSFPWRSGKYLAHGPHVDREEDTKRAIVGILAAGLPMPKSKSIQIEDLQAQGEDDVEGEREERAWWALRFQQVQREIQRSDVPVPLNVARDRELSTGAVARSQMPSSTEVSRRRSFGLHTNRTAP